MRTADIKSAGLDNGEYRDRLTDVESGRVIDIHDDLIDRRQREIAIFST